MSFIAGLEAVFGVPSQLAADETGQDSASA
jgi:hypothetical protein